MDNAKLRFDNTVYKVRIQGTWCLVEVIAKVRKFLVKARIDYLN
jgi:hypothetical protein